CPEATAVRPSSAPTATAAAKSIDVHCASVRRCPIRSATTAVRYISAAFAATIHRSPACPVSQSIAPLSVVDGVLRSTRRVSGNPAGVVAAAGAEAVALDVAGTALLVVVLFDMFLTIFNYDG